ncbi:hypothetical protein B0T18DRAFT_202826 [Schizothecium vesticola]|uniref:Mid2 domain-containing protein n=1 Tax=Schizothecium vesticola TaxID=314040 RepID=A0AA40BTK4_9PEZI|nr:hypothetical protein B0T18DRAFT_202826 [Schizothecium vesticola]
MRSVWSCTSCVALLLSAVFGRGALASHVRPKEGLVHRVAKAQITAPPSLRPRDGAVCPSDHSLCPESLGGDCCPSRYACAADSCYATTAAIASACGQEGWFACPAADSGGCCPVGYVCGPTDCSAPVGVKNTITSCPASYYLCPAEMNFGCCQSGMGCAPNACYSTAPVATTVVQRITTTSDGETITSTRTTVTTTTPTAPPRLVAQDPNVAAKFIPSTLPKTPASSTPASASGGLTSSQLGGIIGGAVALLLVVLVAAFFILKRLSRIHHSLASPSEKSRSSHAPPPQQQYSHVSQTYPYPDDTSIDPLMHPTPNTGGTPSGGLRSRSTSNQFSPTFDPTNPNNKTPRQVSVDSAAGGGYFDLPPRVHNVPGLRGGRRNSVDNSYAPHPYHQRHQSNASDVSDGVGGGGGVTSPLFVQELDSAGYVELPSGGEEGVNRSRANSGGGMASPRGSFQIGGTGRDVSPGFVGSPPLDVVNEHSEIMTGYYGPRDRVMGQTAAGLEVGMDVSSPGGEGYSREVGGVLHPHPPREGGGGEGEGEGR